MIIHENSTHKRPLKSIVQQGAQFRINRHVLQEEFLNRFGHLCVSKLFHTFGENEEKGSPHYIHM